MMLRVRVYLITVLTILSSPILLITAETAETDLRTVYRIVSRDGFESYRFQSEPGSPENGVAAFRVVQSRQWPKGLVPLFWVKRQGRYQLARFPLTGQESLTEPLFFALPTESEPTDPRVFGRWECLAKYSDGAEEYFSWDLTGWGQVISGRFDVDTDFRFASIVEGRLVGGKVLLRVKYIAAEYELTGLLDDTGMKGTWVKTEDGERGTWKARRFDDPSRSLSQESTHLWPWFGPKGAIRFRTTEESLGEGWQRGAEAICRVWLIDTSDPESDASRLLPRRPRAKVLQ